MQSRDYELMFIINPELGDESARELADQYRELLEELGAEINDVDDWGTRRLAFPIDEITEGYYSIIEFWGGSEIVDEVDRRMGLDEDIIRFMTIRLPE